ncbi:MAG TPA: hypothetical protein VG871_15445 [Vicinamibacterales bacterium]|nr:hypothetical protein [Vicinamibacterales bacterium]
MRLTLAMCVLSALIASPAFADPPADPAPAPDPALSGQTTAGPQQLSDSVQLANGKVRIGALFYADYAWYYKTGFGPQFETQTNFQGPGNDNFNIFDVHRTYINLFYSPTDHVTLRLTPNIYRQPITGTGDKTSAVTGISAQADGNLTFRLKYGYLEFGKLFENTDYFKNTNVRFGQQMNPLVDWEEALWDYRWLSLTPWNYLSLSSTQVGASMNGPIGKNGKTYLDYQVGIFNDASFHAFEYSEQKQFMVRGSFYPMGAKTRFQGLGLTIFYDHGYANTAPDLVPTTGAVPVIRGAALAHFTTSNNGFMVGAEYDWGKNAFGVGNLFSGAGPQDSFGLGVTQYAAMSKLTSAILAGTDVKQQGWDVFGRYNIPHSKVGLFAWDEFFQPNTNVPTNPIDFYHVIAGISYRVSPRWRVAFSNQYVLYKHDQFTYPASSIAGFNPALAAANPTGIANAVPGDVHVAMLNFEFSF